MFINKINNRHISKVIDLFRSLGYSYAFGHGSKAGNTLRTAAGEKATTSQGDLR